MSASPSPKEHAQRRKLNISVVLKVPIDLEVDLLGIPDGNNFTIRTEDLESELAVDGINKAELARNVEALSNQLVTQIFQNSHLTQNQQEQDRDISDNPSQNTDLVEVARENSFLLEEVGSEIEPPQPVRKVKGVGRLLDSVNDGFSLAVNAVGVIFFMRKVANYSWEE